LVADEAYLFLPWKVWVSGLGKAAGGWTASADRLLWADRVDDDVTFAVAESGLAAMRHANRSILLKRSV
jgi:hypothetical protein